MLRFKVRRSASVYDRGLGSGQIWVADPENIEYSSKEAEEIEGEEAHRVRWRIAWDDPWDDIEAFWLPDERKFFVDDIMRLEEGESVMFFMPDQGKK
ncbi:MAG TPA: hypothetical protein VLV83_26340 [Acidobacteriota bacterium]|nr:hypothetical protein [Acidobacteriota bacterium]